MADFYVALVHYPVLSKEGRIITSSVTNIDVHDIARSVVTYGASGFYVVTPVDALRGLVRRIMKHWEEGAGGDYNPTRREALASVRLERTLDGAEIDIERSSGTAPLIIASSARPLPQGPPPISYPELTAKIEAPGTPILLLLGTAWGLADPALERCAGVLPPILGPGGPDSYNHLSVRAAAAILLDRLRGKR
jgi:hypothetical protein